MGYILAIFAVRTETIQFYNMLKNAGINAMIVETPKSMQASCGISVKFMPNSIEMAKKLQKMGNFKSFVRFYHITGSIGRNIITPIR